MINKKNIPLSARSEAAEDRKKDLLGLCLFLFLKVSLGLLVHTPINPF